MKAFWQSFLNKFIMLVAIILLCTSVLLSVVRAFTPYAAEHTGDIIKWVEAGIQQPISIGKVQTAWHGMQPVLRLQDVVFYDEDKTTPTLTIKNIDIGFNLFRSLLKWHLQPGLVAIRDTHLKMRQLDNGTVELKGLKFIKPIRLSIQPGSPPSPLVDELLAINHIYLSKINVDWYDKKNRILPIRGLALELKNSGDFHHLWGSVMLSEKDKSRLYINAKLQGQLRQRDSLDASLYFTASDLQLKKWLKNRNLYGVHAIHGLYTGKLWMTIHRAELQKVALNFNVKDLSFKGRELETVSHYQQAKGELAFARTNDHSWRILGQHIDLVQLKQQWHEAKFYLFFNPEKQQLKKLYINQIPVDFANSLLHYVGVHFPKLNNGVLLKPKAGVIDDLLIENLDSPKRLFSARFHDLAFKSQANYPGFSGLSGELLGLGDTINVTLDSKNTHIYLPHDYMAPLEFSTLKVRATVLKNEKGWSLSAKDLTLQNPDMTLHSEMTINQINNQAPVINLLMSGRDINLANLKNYLPTSLKTHKQLYPWMQNAVSRGVGEQLSVLVQGPLDRFPFTDNQGVFRTNLTFRDTDLDYEMFWPIARNIAGELSFRNHRFDVQVNQGFIDNVKIETLHASIPSIGFNNVPVLSVRGFLDGYLNDGIYFLQHSPLKETIGKDFANIEMRGPLKLALGLDIPLKSTAGHVQVRGQVVTDKAALNLKAWHLTADNLSGKLDFVTHGIDAQNVTGTLLGHPIKLNISTENGKGKNNATTQFDIVGQVGIDDLVKQFNWPLNPYLQGTTNYHAVLKFTKDLKISNSLTVTSDLRGVAVSLPKPFIKATKDNSNFNLNLQFNHNAPLRLRMQYADKASAALLYKQATEGVNFYNGEVKIGKDSANFQTEPGLLIDGYVPHVYWSDWSPVWSSVRSPGIEKQKSSTSNNSNSAPTVQKKLLREVKLKIGDLQLFDQQFVRSQITFKPTDTAYQFYFDGPGIAGDLVVPHHLKANPIKANLQRLFLKRPKQKNILPSATFDPRTIPGLQLAVADLRIGDKIYGGVKLRTKPDNSGVEIETFSGDAGAFKYAVAGRWKYLSETDQLTDIHGEFYSKDLGDFLHYYKQAEFIDGSHIDAKFKLKWPGKPFSPEIKTMDGSVKLKMDDGQIKDIGAKADTDIALGRILTLLSFQSLPRRLMLNFNDLFDKGFSFDSLHGDVNIEDGVASSSNLKLSGVVANVDAHGTVNFNNEQINLGLNITPHLTSSLPVIATIAGGPIAGVAAFVANAVFSPAIDSLAMRQYSVKGSWHQPVIAQMHNQSKQQNSHNKLNKKG